MTLVLLAVFVGGLYLLVDDAKPKRGRGQKGVDWTTLGICFFIVVTLYGMG